VLLPTRDFVTGSKTVYNNHRYILHSMSPPARPKRPFLQYVALALLFSVMAVYQYNSIHFRQPNWFGESPVYRLFIVLPASTLNHRPAGAVAFLSPSAHQAGMTYDDVVVAMNGRPLTGKAVYGEEMKKTVPGANLDVTVRRPQPAHANSAEAAKQWRTGARIETTLHVLRPLTDAQSSTNFLQTMIVTIMPMLVVLLGVWVALVRPRDPRAWLVFAATSVYGILFYPGAEFWPPGLRELGEGLRAGYTASLPVWLLLFGIYFPEPFPLNSRWAAVIRWKWVVILPLAFLCLWLGASAAVNMVSYDFATRHLLLPGFIYNAGELLGYVAICAAFLLLAAKYFLAASRDAKRRLRILFLGLLVGLGPYFFIELLGRIGHYSFEQEHQSTAWIVYMMLFLFPIALAYVIVVHRAMDVRLVLRQGLQYALARNGIFVIQAILAGIATYAASRLAFDSGNRVVRLMVVLLSVAVLFALRRAGNRLRSWVDRRFFREAYNAEQVLSELSDQVRTMVEPQPLLQTVVSRVSATLHVPCMAVLMNQGNPFRPVYSVGMDGLQDLEIPSTSATIQLLQREKEPLRIYLDDTGSWIYSDSSEAERLQLARLHPELLLPLAVRDKLLGFITLGPKLSEEPFTGSDLRLLKSVASQTGLALENAQLMAAITEEVAHRERLNREVEIAREVQERLFPQELPPIAGLDYFGACRPALGVGGDYYDFLALSGGELGIAIGDVSGKGIGAALLMASLQASLRAEALRTPDELAPVVSNVNRLVYQASTSNRYATFFYAQYQPRTRELTYVNAGHNPPMLFRKCGAEWQLIRLTIGGTVVGLLESFPYQQDKVQLQPGDLLVAFTDGISEAMNPIDEEWGEDRLAESVKACASSPAREMLEHLMGSADTFAAGAKQHDDMTLVILRVV
jgi:sigma-B regulation protein RsbU (phosphoserine phosphatase)